MKIPLSAACSALLVASMGSAVQGQAHVHGLASLDIAVEPARLTVQFESPLENLVGFERAPRTDAERARVQAAVAKLRAAASLFVIDPAAQCTLANVELTSAVLKLGQPGAGKQEEGHAEIDGEFEFKCLDATKAAFVDVALFDFASLRQLQVRVATAGGQFKRDLKRPAKRIVLAK